jgi:DNA polymerase III subunit delta
MAGVKPEALSRLSAADLTKYKGVLLFGPNWDLVQRLKAAVVLGLSDAIDGAEIVRLAAADVEGEPGRLLEELQGISLFGAFKIVALEAASQAAQRECISATSVGWDDAFLVLTSGDLKKSAPLRKEFEASPHLLAAACYEQSAQELAAVVRDRLAGFGFTSSPEVCLAVVEAVAGNAAMLESEVDKLASYAGDAGQLCLEHVEAVCTVSRSSSLDRVVDLAFSGQVEKALTGLRELHSEGASGTGSLIALCNHLLMICEMASASGDARRAEAVVKDWRPPVFWKRQPVIVDHVRRLSRVDVSSLIDALAGASAMARKSHQIEWPVLERVVLALSSRLK